MLRRWFARLAGAIALALLLPCLPALAEKRVALVIGNSAYKYAGELANPRNDAADIAAELTRLGFEVVRGIDLTKAEMDKTIKSFADKLIGVDTALFFYAGHGLQVSGANYLVPIDAQLTTSAALDFEMIRLDLVQRTMERETKTNILFLDACRDNPLARNLARAMGTRSAAAIGRGLAALESGAGTLIGFSTQPGNVAQDGEGHNSPYAGALIKQLRASREDISTMLIDVRNDVMSATRDRQTPWEHSALRARFYFSAPPKQPVAVAPLPSGQDPQADLVYWQEVRESKDPVVVQSYLDQFPQGRFAPIARLRVASLNQEREQRLLAERQEAERRRLEAEKQATLAREAEERRKAAALEEARRRSDEERRRVEEAQRKADEERQRLALQAEQSRRQAETAKCLAEEARSEAAIPPKLIEDSFRQEIRIEVQSHLKRRGLLQGETDGTFGQQTRAAIVSFQRSIGARTTGYLTPCQLQALGAS